MLSHVEACIFGDMVWGQLELMPRHFTGCLRILQHSPVSTDSFVFLRRTTHTTTPRLQPTGVMDGVAICHPWVGEVKLLKIAASGRNSVRRVSGWGEEDDLVFTSQVGEVQDELCLGDHRFPSRSPQDAHPYRSSLRPAPSRRCGTRPTVELGWRRWRRQGAAPRPLGMPGARSHTHTRSPCSRAGGQRVELRGSQGRARGRGAGSALAVPRGGRGLRRSARAGRGCSPGVGGWEGKGGTGREGRGVARAAQPQFAS